MPPKSKSETLWSQCETCSSYIPTKSIKNHSTECSLNVESRTCNFIKDNVLYGTLDLKSNEEIKNIATCQRDMMAFVSQSVLQLLNISIGDWIVLTDLANNGGHVARIVWPTSEKSCSSILLTKNGLDLSLFKLNSILSLEKLVENQAEAHQVFVIIISGGKNIDISSELQNRLQKLFLNKYITIENRISIMFYGKTLCFEIKKIQPFADEVVGDVSKLTEKINSLSTGDPKQLFYKITDKSTWNIYRTNKEYERVEETIDPFNKIGGLDDEIDEIEQLMNMALSKNVHYKNSLVCRSLLIYGSSGTGKSLLLDALRKSTTANVLSLTPSELFAQKEPLEEVISETFSRAIKCAPSLIIIDDVDTLCPNRSQRSNDTEKKMISTLLQGFDKLNRQGSCRVFVLAATNKPENLDASFRRCGRFDREIEIPTPNAKARYAILNKLLREGTHNVTEEELRDIANIAHGYVGADLIALCSMATFDAYKNHQERLRYTNLLYALKRVKPSAMREVQIEVPNVKWSDVGGLDTLKLVLRQCVEWPLKHAASFVRLGITPPKGVLMFGPPGCSKTMAARALATESGLNFLSIKGPELFSKWVGESERAVREVFRKARNVAPSIIFFDEIDALGGERSSGSTTTSVQERVLAQLLTELDGITPLNNVTILAATNRPDRIDKALLRPGRLDKIIYMPLPDEKTRHEIFRIKLAKMPTDGVNLNELVDRTEGYSGAEINAVCHEAALKALEENIDSETVSMKHFEMSLQIMKPRTPASLLEIYEKYLTNT